MRSEELLTRLEEFPKRYFQNFNNLWKWKIKIENEETSILDEDHIQVAYRKLQDILPKWQTYRNGNNGSSLRTLKTSLTNISESYNQIRGYTLLDFKEIPKEPLRKIWDELGRVKEYEGQTNPGGYYFAISVCKPLLLLWGQTPAFDSKVRKNLPRSYGVRYYKSKLVFSEWYDAMCKLSEDLNNDESSVNLMNNDSLKRYKSSTPVPYGRYMDIYYWIGNYSLKQMEKLSNSNIF